MEGTREQPKGTALNVTQEKNAWHNMETLRTG